MVLVPEQRVQLQRFQTIFREHQSWRLEEPLELAESVAAGWGLAQAC